MQRYVSSGRRRELNDKELMMSLRQAFLEVGESNMETERPDKCWKERYGPLDYETESESEDELADPNAPYRNSRNFHRNHDNQPGDAGLYAGSSLNEPRLGRRF